MTKFRDIKVVLRSPDGHYLAGGPIYWELSDRLDRAAVFDYLKDNIEAQLEAVRQSQGLILEAVHVASHELHETCDRCDGTVAPINAFFDGKQFLCPDCSPQGAPALAA